MYIATSARCVVPSSITSKSALYSRDVNSFRDGVGWVVEQTRFK